MQTNEQMTKHVKFAEDTKDNSTYTPLAKPHASALRKLWIKRSREGNYAQLAKEFLSLQQKGLTNERFFTREGRCLLHWALISFPNSEGFDFICKNLPKHLLQQTLSEDNYSLLDEFLRMETGMEKYNQIDEEELRHRLAKLELLLSIDPERIQAVLDEYLSKEGIGQGVKASIKKALSSSNQYSRRNQQIF